MKLLKSRFIVFAVTFLIGLIPLYMAYLFVIRYSDNPVAMLIYPDSITLIVLTIILGLWVFLLNLTGQGFFDVFRKRESKQKEMGKLKRKIDKIKTSIKVAQVEYFKRRITKKTLDNMLASYGKDMVDIKSRLKELERGKD